DVAADNTDENAGGAGHTLGAVLEDQDNDHNDESDEQVFQGAVVLGRGTAAEGAHSDADQGQADGHNHGTGDHRREEAAQGFEEGAQHRFKQAAHDGGAHDGTIAENTAAHDLIDALEYADEAGAGTHDDGHLAA